MIQKILFLLSLMYFESDAFSSLDLHRNYHNKEINHIQLFGTRSSPTNTIGFYFNKNANIKTRGNEAKLYYQNPQYFDFWIEDTEIKVKDNSTPNTSICSSEPRESHTNISNLKNLAIEEKYLVEKMNGFSSENKCNYRSKCKKAKESHEIALQNARNADLEYGLCSIESLNAWDTVDEKLKSCKRKSNDGHNDFLIALQFIDH